MGGQAERADAVRFPYPSDPRRGGASMPPSPMAEADASSTPSRMGRGPEVCQNHTASARPAHGGCFSPAGSGAGLAWHMGTPMCGAPARAGGGNATRVSLIRPNPAHRCFYTSLTMAKAGTSAIPRQLVQDRAVPPRLWPAPVPPPAGAPHPPGRAVASVPHDCTDVRGTVTHGRGKRHAFTPPESGAAVLQYLPHHGRG